MPEEEGASSSSSSSAAREIERGVVNSKSRSCRGCLYYSSYLRDNNRNPTCYGFSRSIPHSYRTMDREREATKDFKYTCLGYGVSKEVTPSSKPSEGNGELPLCVGIEFLADRRPVSHPSHTRKDETDAAPPTPSPLSRPPSANGAQIAPGDEFPTRFFRSAGLVASGVMNNISRLAGAVRSTVDDIFYPERRRPK